MPDPTTPSLEDQIHSAWAKVQHRKERIDGGHEPSTWVDLDSPRLSASGKWVQVRGASALATLREKIRFADRAGSDSSQLFAGFSGSGKTTVLLQLQDALNDDGMVVVAVDALDYHDGAGPPSIEAMLITLAVAIGQQMTTVQPKSTATLPAWAGFLGRLKGLISSLDADLGGVVDLKWLKLHLRSGSSFHERLAGVLSRKRGEVFEAFQMFFAEIVASFSGVRPVLLIDGLEKLSQQVDKTPAAYRQFAEFFVQHGDVLKIDGAHLVYVVPPQTFVVAPQLQTTFDFVQLSCARVSSPPPHGADERDEAGCAALEEVLAARIDVDALFEPATRRELAFRSGGHLRTLLNIAGAVLMAASKDEHGTYALPIPINRAKHAIRDHAAHRRQAARFNAPVLRAVSRQGDVSQLNSGLLDSLLLAQDLELILAYRNGDFWCDVHPLVRSILED